ncbi:MAG: hypothetical protein ACE5JI_20855, partial [Acidobacteriota bacterium]
EDEPGEESSCARGPGFYCQNQDGGNPNAVDFEMWVTVAAILLEPVDDIGSPEDIRQAVCDTGNQLLRQLTTLALNLAAGKVSMETPLMDEDFANVEEVFLRAIELVNDDNPGGEEVEAVKDVLERINHNENFEADPACSDDGDDGEPAGQQPAGNKITICHKNKKTLSISINAWPAHQAHGDTMGPCGS